MGTYRIEIQAVGGHGHHREVKEGESLPTTCGVPGCPDCIANHFVTVMLREHQNIESAKIIHWPGSPEQVTDDILNNVREQGNF